MQICTERSQQLSALSRQQLGTYRHRVFVEQLGWQLACQHSLEFDQFDHAEAVYIVARNQDGHINGCARLLPTTKPYLLAEIFPQLLNGAPPPSAQDIWELSRFAAMDFNATNTIKAGQFSSDLALQLLDEAIEFAQKNGIRYLLTVSPVGIERLLRLSGAQTSRLGPPQNIGGHWLYAMMIHCDHRRTSCVPRASMQ